MKQFAMFAWLVVALSGCATSPVTVGSSQSVPEDRFLDGYSSLASPSAESIKITIVRDSGFSGAAAATKLSIDGVGIANFRSSERLDIHLIPGTYIFSVEPSPRLGGALVEQSFEVGADKPRIFRISFDMTKFSIQPTAQLD